MSVVVDVMRKRDTRLLRQCASIMITNSYSRNYFELVLLVSSIQTRK